MSDDNSTVYDQEFFLALARPSADTDRARVEARDRWNNWIDENPDIIIDFEGVDFQDFEFRKYSFNGFKFNNSTIFANSKFPRNFDFSHSIFGNETTFNESEFGANCNFSFSIFGKNANFSYSIFNRGTRFIETIFGESVDFSMSKFGNSTRFDKSIIGGWADFSNTAFGRSSSFSGAAILYNADYSGASFGEAADFSGIPGEIDRAVMEKIWAKESTISKLQKQNEYYEHRIHAGFGSDRFSKISFNHAHFQGYVSFSKRSFEYSADFTSTTFDKPPDLDQTKNIHRIDFTGAKVSFAPASRKFWTTNWTFDSNTAINLRVLRALIEITKNHDFERDLYIEERKAEKGIFLKIYFDRKDYSSLIVHICWIFVMTFYSAFADYGRSFARPAIALLLSFPAYYCIYSILLADKMEMAGRKAHDVVIASHVGADALPTVRAAAAKAKQTVADYDATVSQLALSNAVPFVGPLTIDADAKKFLLCGEWPKPAGATTTSTEACIPIPPPGYQLAMISQNVLSIILVFFIGLALRNYFRVK